MPHSSNARNMSFIALVLGLLIGCQNSTFGQLEGIDGFTEPFHRIDLSSDESGAIESVKVAVGDSVNAGDLVACLDSKLQQIQLEIARQAASAKSNLAQAEKGLEKRLSILAQLKQLRAKGHAGVTEVIKAEMECEIAEARVLSIKEEVKIRQLEQNRAQVMLERRMIRAPFSGIVSKIHRREGEYLSPVSPEVVTIIADEKLLAKFAVPYSQSSQFEIGREFEIEIGEGQTVVGQVSEIGVEVDAQSGTIEIKLVIDNRDRLIKSGQPCTLNI